MSNDKSADKSKSENKPKENGTSKPGVSINPKDGVSKPGVSINPK